MAKSDQTFSKLAQWTEKINATSSRDPLGLANRVSQRLVHQLLFGITAIGRRARYYSYSLWSIYDVLKREKPLGYKDLADGIYWRDCAFVTACLLHHKDDDYNLDGAVGQDKGSKYLKTAGKVLDLANIKHIESSPEGGFGLNYKGSLINLGFFCNVSVDIAQTDITYEVSDQPAIKEMINLFENNIKDTTFYQKYACQRKPVPREVLEEFGEKACLCLLHKQNAPEKNILRDILFERKEGYKAEPSYRPESLRLILYCAKLCSELGVSLEEWQFRTMVYYGQYYYDHKNHHTKTKPITFNKGVENIRNRWRYFFMHHYFSIATEGLLVVILNMLSEAVDTGLTISQIIEQLNSGGTSKVLKDLIGLRNITFEKTTIREALKYITDNFSNNSPSPWTFINADCTISEENLITTLKESIRSSNAEAAAKCLLIILIMLERYDRLQEDKYLGWALSVSSDDFQRNISLPVLFLYLKNKKQDWRNLSLQKLLELIISRFVVEQHELMIPEKTAGTSWLSYDNGHMYFENDFDGPSPGSSRFEAANQILCDLGLISYNDETIPNISAYSETILSEILQ